MPMVVISLVSTRSKQTEHSVILALCGEGRSTAGMAVQLVVQSLLGFVMSRSKRSKRRRSFEKLELVVEKSLSFWLKG